MKEILQNMFMKSIHSIKKLKELYSYLKAERNIDSESFIQLYDSIDSKQEQVLLDEYNKYITPYKNYCKHCEKFYDEKYSKCPSDNSHLIYKSSRKYEECTRCNMLTDIYTSKTKVCRWCNSHYFKVNEDKMNHLPKMKK